MLGAMRSHLLDAARVWLLQHAHTHRTDADDIRLLRHRIDQVGRLNRRLRRAHAALEDALLRVHDRTAASGSVRSTPVRASRAASTLAERS